MTVLYIVSKTNLKNIQTRETINKSYGVIASKIMFLILRPALSSNILSAFYLCSINNAIITLPSIMRFIHVFVFYFH